MQEKMNYLDFDIAIEKSLDLVKSTNQTEFVSIFDALNRVLTKKEELKRTLHLKLVVLEKL